MSKKKKIEFAGNRFPTGVCVKTDNGSFYVQGKTRLRITSDAVLNSWSFPYTLWANGRSLADYPIAGKLGFRPGTIIYSMVDGLYYLIENNKKRQITDPRWFDWFGINRLNAVVASAADIELHKTGEVL